MNVLQNRIVAHRQLPASALKPHPLNPRTHPDEQRSVLRQLLAEIGLARSVLAYVADEERATALAAPDGDPLLTLSVLLWPPLHLLSSPISAEWNDLTLSRLRTSFFLV